MLACSLSLVFKNVSNRRGVLLGQEGVEKQECVVSATSNWISTKKGQSTKVVSKWKPEHVSVRVREEGFSSALKVIVIHSKYFPDSDWLKTHV